MDSSSTKAAETLLGPPKSPAGSEHSGEGMAFRTFSPAPTLPPYEAPPPLPLPPPTPPGGRRPLPNPIGPIHRIGSPSLAPPPPGPPFEITRQRSSETIASRRSSVSVEKDQSTSGGAMMVRSGYEGRSEGVGIEAWRRQAVQHRGSVDEMSSTDGGGGGGAHSEYGGASESVSTAASLTAAEIAAQHLRLAEHHLRLAQQMGIDSAPAQAPPSSSSSSPSVISSGASAFSGRVPQRYPNPRQTSGASTDTSLPSPAEELASLKHREAFPDEGRSTPQADQHPAPSFEDSIEELKTPPAHPHSQFRMAQPSMPAFARPRPSQTKPRPDSQTLPTLLAGQYAESPAPSYLGVPSSQTIPEEGEGRSSLESTLAFFRGPEEDEEDQKYYDSNPGKQVESTQQYVMSPTELDESGPYRHFFHDNPTPSYHSHVDATHDASPHVYGQPIAQPARARAASNYSSSASLSSLGSIREYGMHAYGTPPVPTAGYAAHLVHRSAPPPRVAEDAQAFHGFRPRLPSAASVSQSRYYSQHPPPLPHQPWPPGPYGYGPDQFGMQQNYYTAVQQTQSLPTRSLAIHSQPLVYDHTASLPFAMQPRSGAPAPYRPPPPPVARAVPQPVGDPYLTQRGPSHSYSNPQLPQYRQASFQSTASLPSVTVEPPNHAVRKDSNTSTFSQPFPPHSSTTSLVSKSEYLKGGFIHPDLKPQRTPSIAESTRSRGGRMMSMLRPSTKLVRFQSPSPDQRSKSKTPEEEAQEAQERKTTAMEQLEKSFQMLM